ncbi:MAG TPA: SCO family protein [Steroidobacteraceae bacterium]|nr:SCO family protein [Steroidobacteraceae bacterium]
MSALSLKALAVAAGILGVPAAALPAVDPGVAVAPRIEFTPPRPGTYRLQKIQPATDATLLDPSGRPVRLSADTTGKITLLTFFYTYCADPIGCPLAYRTLLDVRAGVGRVAGLEQRVRFLSVSLDPTIDTPAAIGNYRDMVSEDSTLEWDVLTARSVRDLLPVLEDFGQDVSVEQAADGSARRTVHHMLKMFLIDHTGMVREIYTLAFLQPEVILNDIETLYLEEKPRASRSRRPDHLRSKIQAQID